MRVFLETFFTTLNATHVNYFRSCIDITHSMDDPDTLINNYVNSGGINIPVFQTSDFLIHSTSWRYELEGHIVLTYIIYSDRLDFKELMIKTLPTKSLRHTSGTNTRRPRPEIIKEEHVVAHALRHLGFLIQTDHKHTYTKLLTSETVEILKSIFADLAGEIKL